MRSLVYVSFGLPALVDLHMRIGMCPIKELKGKSVKRLIMITGPMGVGKTVTGKALCDRLGRTAFIDGDWCLDIHPFIGNKETKSMAVDNIVHLTTNYANCSECDDIVVSWVMSQATVDRILLGLRGVELATYCIVLICSSEALLDRWHGDCGTEWRTQDWLLKSVKSLQSYASRTDGIVIDTTGMNVDHVVGEIIRELSAAAPRT
jgi:hypothetical protein